MQAVGAPGVLILGRTCGKRGDARTNSEGSIRGKRDGGLHTHGSNPEAHAHRERARDDEGRN